MILNLIEYNIIIFNFVLVSLISGIMLCLSYFLTTFNKLNNLQKLFPYECGFQPFEDSRHLFDINFYIIGILFVVFDLEIIFLFPWVKSITIVQYEGFCSIMVFFFLLIIV